MEPQGFLGNAIVTLRAGVGVGNQGQGWRESGKEGE